MVKFKSLAVAGVVASALLSVPLAGGTAFADASAASCSKQKVNGYTGRASCTSLDGYNAYRVVVECIGNSGRQFNVTGPWVKSGWSTASCSGNGSAGIYGFVDVELQY
ncbi:MULTISPECIES: hypothetical protein [Streptomyces]|uniref:Uncharacterized protein n=1 Tax=Streptomyces spororaveus TaxID=284039 RepID=A0ABQ3TBW5_9ACTN|nr:MULTISPECIES: hypothetical protein [Streptomyces]MCM9081745.1 hypothetical protein [Streptomyces spororaveus]MCX5303826.1 hypothetical protein [Streptomyces sp. NBC_00160]GHI77839.1 hypothetical protein Sspor_34000 [Streptomyces spororaveus]